MSAQIEAAEIAIRGVDAVAADPILLPLTQKWDADLSEADLTGAKLILIRTLQGADGCRWDVTLVRDAGVWTVDTVDSDADADGDADDYAGDLAFILDRSDIAAAA